MIYYWTEFKYWLADKLFEQELDEAFEMGIREGARRQRVSTIVDLRAQLDSAPKSSHQGINLAIELLGGN